MIKVAVLDDYQSVFEEIIDIEKFKNKFNFKIFNEAFNDENEAIELIGPNRSSMFIQLMPLFSAIMAIIIFKEKFQLFHFIGASFIISGIYLSNRKTQ